MKKKSLLPCITQNQSNREKTLINRYGKHPILRFCTLEKRRVSAREHIIHAAPQNNFLRFNSQLDRQSRRENAKESTRQSVDLIQESPYYKNTNSHPKYWNENKEKKLRLLYILDRVCERYRPDKKYRFPNKLDSMRGASQHRRKHLYFPQCNRNELQFSSRSALASHSKRKDTQDLQRKGKIDFRKSRNYMHQKSCIEKSTKKMSLEEEPDSLGEKYPIIERPRPVESPIVLAESILRIPPSPVEERKVVPRLNQERLHQLLRPPSRRVEEEARSNASTMIGFDNREVIIHDVEVISTEGDEVR